MGSMDQICPVCSTAPTEVTGWGPLVRIKCDRCGEFNLTDSLNQDLPGFFLRMPPQAAAIMSHTIRRMQRQGRQITVFPNTVQTFLSNGHLPTPNEQADELILWIGDNQPDSASNASAPELLLDAWIGAALPRIAGNASGFRWLLTSMESNPAVPKPFTHSSANRVASFNLTLEGWSRYAALKQARNESRTAFMAMKFGDAELDDVVDRCFRPAVQRTGFELRVLTDNQRAGLIDDQIRSALLSARFVVADLTHGSFGAYWEAGFADGRGLPVIYTCKRAEWQKAKTHFDTNHMATVLWDVGDLKPSEDEMTSIIRATLRADAKQTDE